MLFTGSTSTNKEMPKHILLMIFKVFVDSLLINNSNLSISLCAPAEITISLISHPGRWQSNWGNISSFLREAIISSETIKLNQDLMASFIKFNILPANPNTQYGIQIIPISQEILFSLY